MKKKYRKENQPANKYNMIFFSLKFQFNTFSYAILQALKFKNTLADA